MCALTGQFRKPGNLTCEGPCGWCLERWCGFHRQAHTLGHTCTGTCICTMYEDEDGEKELVWNPECPVVGHTECNGSQEGFENDYLCSANARFSSQVCTIGHTCTGSCICTKWEYYPYYVDVNPGCPVAGHSAAVVSVDFSPDGKRFVSGSEDKFVRIWNTETGGKVSSHVCTG